jgi:hypothetical protein
MPDMRKRARHPIGITHRTIVKNKGRVQSLNRLQRLRTAPDSRTIAGVTFIDGAQQP